MNLLVTGGTGFIGKRLVRNLFLDNHTVTVLTRDVERAKSVLSSELQCEILPWNPKTEPLPSHYLNHIQGIIHFAGESIIHGSWNAEKKQEILDSRVQGLNRILECLRKHPQPEVKTILLASAIGYYGDRADEELTENSTAGKGFLAEVCQKVESTLLEEPLPGVRKMIIRNGIVLDKSGGLLERLLPLFKVRLGGSLGSGKQWLSWIYRDDLVALIQFLIKNKHLDGIFNATAPHPVTHQMFSQTLAQVLGRKGQLWIPEPLIRLALGARAETVLSSQKVLPTRALASGFQFKNPEIEDAIRQTSGISLKLTL
jgi:uncharacterized protein (TIGR01777 family)